MFQLSHIIFNSQPSPEPDPDPFPEQPDYLTLIALEDNSTVRLDQGIESEGNYDGTIYYRTDILKDMQTYYDPDPQSQHYLPQPATLTLNKGDFVQFNDNRSYSLFMSDIYNSFYLTGKWKVVGNICTSFQKLPQKSCYRLFENCNGLINIDIITNHIQVQDFMSTFINCKDLKDFKLMIVNPIDNNYTNKQLGFYNLLNGCSNLSSITVNFVNWIYAESPCTQNWVNGVAENGIFKCPQELPHTEDYRGVDYIPNGWTIEYI